MDHAVARTDFAMEYHYRKAKRYVAVTKNIDADIFGNLMMQATG